MLIFGPRLQRRSWWRHVCFGGFYSVQHRNSIGKDLSSFVYFGLTFAATCNSHHLMPQASRLTPHIPPIFGKVKIECKILLLWVLTRDSFFGLNILHCNIRMSKPTQYISTQLFYSFVLVVLPAMNYCVSLGRNASNLLIDTSFHTSQWHSSKS